MYFGLKKIGCNFFSFKDNSDKISPLVEVIFLLRLDQIQVRKSAKEVWLLMATPAFEVWQAPRDFIFFKEYFFEGFSMESASGNLIVFFPFFGWGVVPKNGPKVEKRG